MAVSSLDERKAAARLASDAARGLTSRIEELHRALAARGLRAAGPPVRTLHDGIAGIVYASVRGGLGAAGALAAAVVPPAVDRRPPRPARALALSALNAAIGDRLERERSPLALDMTIRVAGADVEPERAALARAFPDASPRIAVFVHGLGENELAWRLGREHHGGRTYGTRLRDELGYTPVYVRYNTGLAVAANGRRLAALAARLAEEWPCEPERIVLVGHSMGGLVSRCACHAANSSEAAWAGLVTDVVYLGSPHLGAPLAKGAGVAARALAALPETAPIATVIDGLSEGIRDLAAECGEPFVDGVRQHFVIATLTREHTHPAGRLVGDLLVQAASGACDPDCARTLAFSAGDGRHFGGRHHFSLLNDAAIYEQLRDWVA